jgi:putative endonuclease
MEEVKVEKKYYFYMLRCSDNSLYCGQTTDIDRRVLEHNSSRKGAKYTKSRRPVELIYVEEHVSIKDVLKREVAVKRWPKAKKEQLAMSSKKAE